MVEWVAKAESQLDFFYPPHGGNPFYAGAWGSFMYSITFKVPGKPIAKPRMSQRDKWKMRPICMAFYGYRDRIRRAIRTHFESMTSIRAFTKAKLSCSFNVAGHPRLDIGNLIKSVEDSIVPILILDDDLKHIPEYGKVRGTFICDTCNSKRIKRNGKFADDCGDIDACPFCNTVITMEEIK